MKKHDYRNQVLTTFRDLSKKYPHTTLGAHIARATADYPDTEALTDKCLLELMQTYQTSLDLDFFPAHSRISDKFYDADESYEYGQEEL